MPLNGSQIIHSDLADHLSTWRNRGLPDTCTITRPSLAAPTINPTTLVATPAAATTIYTGACHVQPGGGIADRTVIAGDAATVLDTYLASIQLAETDVRPGDLLTVTASDDPGLQGRAFVVTEVVADSVPSRRLLRLVDQARAEREGT